MHIFCPVFILDLFCPFNSDDSEAFTDFRLNRRHFRLNRRLFLANLGGGVEEQPHFTSFGQLKKAKLG